MGASRHSGLSVEWYYKAIIKDGNWAGCPAGHPSPTGFGPGLHRILGGFLNLGLARDGPIKLNFWLGPGSHLCNLFGGPLMRNFIFGKLPGF
jgi:hypothetical protein